MHRHKPHLILLLLPPTKEEVNAFARVCLSVCLSRVKIKGVLHGVMASDSKPGKFFSFDP